MTNIKAVITQDGRESGKSLAHQQVRFVLSKSRDENVAGLWMGLDNTASLRQVYPYIKNKEKRLDPPLSDKERRNFEKGATKLLKNNGISNVRFVWVPA